MLTSQQITNMLELQDRLNRHVNPGWKNAGYDWPMAIMAECTELADQVGWKWWKRCSCRCRIRSFLLRSLRFWSCWLSGCRFACF